MKRRIHNILSVAAEENVQILILGAWGTGVFKNETKDIAELFEHFLKNGGAFENIFEQIVFAVGNDKDKVRIFEQHILD